MLPNRPLTKRELGMICVVVGLVGFFAVLSIDIIDAGRESGIGPARRLALGLTLALAVLGLTLLPIKDDLA